MIDKNIQEKIYSGVLGKIIGVYMGRPVEGWSYQAIIDKFDEVDRYVNKDLNIPLIVADDDISGTFGFFRAMEDFNYKKDLSAKEVGKTWLNYIVEDKSILWWGGLGRSTEHTAYLRLKNRIDAPLSGSIEYNGKTLAEQIGAQIFIDAFAMMNPNDPDSAAYYVKEAASVSHDGMAVEAAMYLAAIEANAFNEVNIDKLLDNNFHYINNPILKNMIIDVRNICSKYDRSTWRRVRYEIAQKYGYDKFNGPCHIIPNHALVIASLLLGADNFYDSVTIASSAAWDTDCNAGNVGCINGIRLGLNAINEKPFLRNEVADRLLVVTSEGGSCISDAVIETKKIIKAANEIRGFADNQSISRFDFSFKNSVQGFSVCPFVEAGKLLDNKKEFKSLNSDDKIGLNLDIKDILSISTPTFIDFDELASNFSTIASPTLYEGQDVVIQIETDKKALLIPYILYYDEYQKIKYSTINEIELNKGLNSYNFEIPNINGMPIFRLGFTFKTNNSSVRINSIDWSNTPKYFAQKGMLLKSIWETNPYWLQSWVGSAKQFAADFNHTYCISHIEDNGTMTIGSQDFQDYFVETNLIFSLHKAAGVIVRAKGLLNYIAVSFENYNKINVIEMNNGDSTLLKSFDYEYSEDEMYNLKVKIKGTNLSLFVNNQDFEDVKVTRDKGSLGFIVSQGTIVARDFIIKRI